MRALELPWPVEALEARYRAAGSAPAARRYHGLWLRKKGLSAAPILPGIMRADPDFRDALSARFTHVHVDEYQDVNRASAMFITLIPGPVNCLRLAGCSLRKASANSTVKIAACGTKATLKSGDRCANIGAITAPTASQITCRQTSTRPVA